MTKKLLLKGKWCLFLYLSVLTLYNCRKDNMPDIEVKQTRITTEEAKNYFQKSVLPSSPKSQGAIRRGKPISIEDVISGKEDQLLYKQPVWDSAYYRVRGGDTLLAVPIRFDIPAFQLTGKSEGVYFNQLNYLSFLKDHNGQLSAEWITLYPDSSWLHGKRNFYTGKIKVSDWDGNMLRGYIYDKYGREQRLMVGQNLQLVRTAGKAELSISPAIKPPGVLAEKYKDIWGDCWEDVTQDVINDEIVLYRKQVDCEGGEGLRPPPVERPVLGEDGYIPPVGSPNEDYSGLPLRDGPCSNMVTHDNISGSGPKPLPPCKPTITVYEEPLENKVPKALNNLCPQSFKFQKIGDNWQEASVKGIVISSITDNFLEHMWNVITLQPSVFTAAFDLEVGAPGYYPAANLARETAKAANRTLKGIMMSHKVGGMVNLVKMGTFGMKFAELMQIELNQYIPGARVYNKLSGRTAPSVPITGGLECQ